MVHDKVGIPINLVYDDPQTYRLYTAGDQEFERLYGHLKDFWSHRGDGMTDEEIAFILERYRTGLDHPMRRRPAEKVIERAAPRVGAGRVCRVLDLGCANGCLLHTLKDMKKETGIEFTGIEPWKPYVDDLRTHLPEHQIIQADIEAFLEMDDKDIPGAPFHIFYSSGTLCMAPPRLARAVLAKAAGLCSEIIIWDYLLNGMSNIKLSENTIFEHMKSQNQYYFAHNFDVYFEEIGYSRVTSQLVPYPDGKVGWGVVHAMPKVA